MGFNRFRPVEKELRALVHRLNVRMRFEIRIEKALVTILKNGLAADISSPDDRDPVISCVVFENKPIEHRVGCEVFFAAPLSDLTSRKIWQRPFPIRARMNRAEINRRVDDFYGAIRDLDNAGFDKGLFKGLRRFRYQRIAETVLKNG